MPTLTTQTPSVVGQHILFFCILLKTSGQVLRNIETRKTFGDTVWNILKQPFFQNLDIQNTVIELYACSYSRTKKECLYFVKGYL